MRSRDGAFRPPPRKHLPLDGLRVLDIGCGGGLLSEPLALLGADVVGIDATAKLVHVASVHAAANYVDVDYRHVLAEDLAAAGERFDIIINAEVIEHVANVGGFVEACCRLMNPGGIMVVATLNRTVKSLLFAKIAGEYILRLLPKGTHDWNRFIRPGELAGSLKRHGVSLTELVGVTYSPWTGAFRVGDDTSVNYMAVAIRPDKPGWKWWTPESGHLAAHQPATRPSSVSTLIGLGGGLSQRMR